MWLAAVSEQPVAAGAGAILDMILEAAAGFQQLKLRYGQKATHPVDTGHSIIVAARHWRMYLELHLGATKKRLRRFQASMLSRIHDS